MPEMVWRGDGAAKLTIRLRIFPEFYLDYWIYSHYRDKIISDSPLFIHAFLSLIRGIGSIH